MYLRFQVLLSVFAASLILSIQNTETAKADDKCVRLLRRLLKNPPKNTNIAINSRLSRARYRCHKGFKLVGKPERICKEGRWLEKKEPKCLGSVPCGKPENISHAKFIGSSFNFNDKLRYSCEKGYKLRGPKKRTCRKDGKWSKGPTCKLIRCMNPGNLTMLNGDVFTSDSEYLFGATLAFECNEGFELKGPDTIKCLEFGWSSRRPPYCKEKVCPDPGRPENGDQFGKFKIGSTVRFSCKFGFELHGSRERNCTKNMEWTGSLVTCQDGSTDCPVLGTPISGRKYGSEYNHGDIVRFECNGGFILKGSAVRQCMDNGTWNGTEAICRDELIEASPQDVNTTALKLRKNVIDSLLEYACNHENGTGCEKSSDTVIDSRGRFIDLDDSGGLDLVFVLDASSSVKEDGFKLGMAFVKKLVNTIGTSQRKDGTRIALVTFGTEAKVEFNLRDIDTIEKAIEAIDEVKYSGGATASTLALEKVRDVVVPFARDDSKRVMMFITDGRSNIGGPPKKAAKNLREKKGFEIYSIGIGKRSKERERELMDIASSVKRDTHVIWVTGYDVLKEAIDKAANTKINYSSCGESPADFRARIVGGNDSKKGWWPWQVGLYIPKEKGKLQLICGGALISPQWVLTAAHCFKGKLSKSAKKMTVLENAAQGYLIKAGDHDLKIHEKSEQDKNVKRIVVHPRFIPRLYLNDIALVKVKEKVKLGAFSRTLCLPEKDEGDLAKPNENGYVSGWGATKALKQDQKLAAADKNSDVLQYTSFFIQEDQECSNKTAETLNSTVTFCAGERKGGRDTCHGDSGGAFVREGKRGRDYRWVAVGIVSWGEGCAQKDKYGYYTRVYPFIDWIKKTVEK